MARDEDDASLWGDHFTHRGPDGIDFVKIGNVADGRVAQLFELGGHVTVVIDNVVCAELEAPVATFGPRSGSDDGESGKLCQLDSEGADAPCATDDEERLSGVLGRGIRVNAEAIKEGFPSGESGEGNSRAGGGIETGGALGDDALVDELEFRIGAGSRDVSSVVDFIAFLKNGRFVSGADNGSSGIVAERLRGFTFIWANLRIDGVEADCFNLYQDIVTARRGSRDFVDFRRIGSAAVAEKLNGFHGLSFMGDPRFSRGF